MLFHPVYQDVIISQQSKLETATERLRQLPQEERLTYAKDHKYDLLYFSGTIPAILDLLTEKQQSEFLKGMQDTLNGIKLLGIICYLKSKYITITAAVENLIAELITDNEKHIDEHNLAAITTTVCSTPERVLAFISARIQKVTPLNFNKITQLLAHNAQENFVEGNLDKLSSDNIANMISFIAAAKRAAFIKMHKKHINSYNITQLVNFLEEDERESVIQETIVVTAANLAILTSVLPENKRHLFVLKHDLHVNADNLPSLMLMMPVLDRKLLVSTFGQYINAKNFGVMLQVQQQDAQVEFFEANKEKFLQNKPHGKWLEVIGKLSNPTDRYTVIKNNTAQIFTDDIFTVVWTMDVLSCAHALELAQANLGRVKGIDDFLALFNCKILDLAAKVALIEAYKPTMMEQADQFERVLKINRKLKECYEQVSGKKHINTKNNGLAALNNLIAVVKIHLGLSVASSYDPRFLNNNLGASVVTAQVELPQQKLMNR